MVIDDWPEVITIWHKMGKEKKSDLSQPIIKDHLSLCQFLVSEARSTVCILFYSNFMLVLYND